MSFNIDSFIFVTFLVINLVFGLWSSRGIKTIKEYAVGDRKFSTAAIAATIAATWIGGGVLSQTIAETYRQGLYFIIPTIGDSLVLLVIGYFFAPRMAEFLGKLSIAEAMGDLYSTPIRLITAFIAIISCIGAVAVQFKVSSTLLQLFFEFSNFYAALIAAIIVILYSSLGGIKAVTFTDIIQIFTFAVIIPIISLVIWGTLDGPEEVLLSIARSDLFDYEKVFDIYNPRSWDSILLFLFFIIPTLEPAVFQRITMAKNTDQIRKSFSIATLICLSISLIISWIGILLFTENPNLDPDNLLAHIINNYSYPGLKGVIAVGIMAVVMSTADSYINSAAVLITNDICKPFNIELTTKNGLLLSRIFAIFIGFLAFFLAFSTKSLMDLTFLIWGSYMPIITVPLILAIFGFRSSTKSVLIGMVTGAVVMVVFKVFDFKIKFVIPAMIANAIFLIGSHYLLHQSGGWVGIKNPDPLYTMRVSRKEKLRKFIKAIEDFSLWSFCKGNIPKDDYVYSLFGFFGIISVFSTMYSIPKEVQLANTQLLEFVYHTVLFSSAILLTFPVWPSTFKQQKFIIIAWNIMLPYILVCAPTLLIIISNFGQFQLMIFMLNMMVIALLLRWQVAILMVCSMVFFSVHFYKWYVGAENLDSAISVGLQFKIMYSLLLVSSVLIVFLKPKQYHQELTEEKNKHLNGRIVAKDKEVQEALALKGEFIRNVQHEYHTPMTGIISLSEGMLYAYDQLTDEEKREYLKDIVQNSHKLQTFDENITTLSLLSKPHYKLEREDIALNDLIYERVQICKKLYDQDNEDREFTLDLEDNIVVSADKSYIIQLLDNLLINAIQYCKKGLIRVTLSTDRINAVITVLDEGIGIPKLELFEIFDPFTVSSKTRTPSGGRGVGLAVCRRIAEVHGGEITAESDGKKGAKFTVKLPLHKR